MTLQAFYQKRAEEYTQQATKLTQRYEQLGWVRLLAFLGLVAAIIVMWRETPWWSGMLTTSLGIFAFARLIKWHGRIQTQAAHCERLAQINQAEAQGQTNDFSA